jgi:rsbT co-antagonist protein RsbR
MADNTSHDDLHAEIAALRQRVAELEELLAQQQVLQQQTIEEKEMALRELSTPLIPLADGVVALPLIGSIDSNRIQQIMETLLEGISEQQADVALIDITGVKMVDTQVADGLLRAAQAAKLLGAQVVLTGISSDIAQTLVHLGADLNGIITHATLQSGIAFAMEQHDIG